MALPAVKLDDDLAVSPDTRLETLQRDYAELNAAIFEAAQVHRRLCAPSGTISKRAYAAVRAFVTGWCVVL